MEVSPNITTVVTSVAHAKCYPNNVPIPISGRQSSITQSNTTSLSVTLKAANGSIETLSANLNLAIVYDVQKATAVQRMKQVNKNVYVKIACANNAGGTVGPWNLGLPDCFNLEAVYVSNNFTENTAFDRTDQFIVNDGQKDGMYSLSTMTRVPGTTLSLANTDTLLIKLDTFQHVGGDGFLSVDSYPIDDANTANTHAITTAQIPYFFSDLTGNKFNLRDCIDFRPVCSNTAVYSSNAASATINPSNTVTIASATENFVVSPNSPFITGFEYYMPRIDSFVLDSSGNFIVLEGTASDNPRPPVDVVGTMTLGLINVKPYPSLSQQEVHDTNRSSYLVSLLNQQVARYTMKDLRELGGRVDSLESYASLSLLEKKTDDQKVKDANNLDRFKNGIFVDGFDDYTVANLSDHEFSCVLDIPNSVVRPATLQQSLEMKWASGSGTYNSGEVASLAYSANTLLQQAKQSGTRTLGGVSWQEAPPVPNIWPPYDPTYDEYTPPVQSAPRQYFSTHWNAAGYVDYYTNSDNTQKFTVADVAKYDGFGGNVTAFLIAEGGFNVPHPELHGDFPTIDAMPFSSL
jgi:hypothetical protein